MYINSDIIYYSILVSSIYIIKYEKELETVTIY